MLASAGANPEVENARGETAAAWARKAGNDDIALLLDAVQQHGLRKGLKAAGHSATPRKAAAASPRA